MDSKLVLGGRWMATCIRVLLLSVFLTTHSMAEMNSVVKNPEDISGECGIPTGETDSVYRLAGQVFRYDDFVLPVRQSFYELEMEHFYKQKQLIDDALWQYHLAEESKRQHKSVGEVALSLIPPQKASEAELKSFYNANKKHISGSYEQVKEQIEQYLAQQHALDVRNSILDKLKADQHFELLIELPVAPVAVIDTEGYPGRGNPLGAVEIVEFADYQCPHCQKASLVVKSLLKKFDNIRMVYIDFPINRSGISRKVALGGVCAAEQNKFWEYHDLAFKSQSALSNDSPSEFARLLDLDSKQFADCLASDKPEQAVSKAKSEGQRLGVTGTPSFFVNGRKLYAHGNLEDALTEAIEQAAGSLQTDS